VRAVAAPFSAPLRFEAIADIVDPWKLAFPAIEAEPPSPPETAARVVEPQAATPQVAAPQAAAPQAATPQVATPQVAAPQPTPQRPDPAIAPDRGIEVPSHDLAATPVVAPRPSERTPFDAESVRREFPILQERVNGRRLVWLDSAATTQKPQAVIDRLSRFYARENSNVHRGAHTLAARATDAYESARETVRRFLHAPSTREIVFVRGATEGINLVAQSWGRRNVGPGDEIVITWLEHHANIVPWQLLCSEKGARLRVAPVDDRGQIILEEYERLLGPRTRLVAFPQVSNALGTITPAKEMIELAHRRGARVLVDGAQAVSHMSVDVQALDCDFYVFSGHKVFAPTGIGVVFGKSDVLAAMPPWQGGGNMIQDVTFERTLYQEAPARLEAGTGSIGDAAGLGAALDWLSRIGVENVGRHEHDLLAYGTERLSTVPGLRMIGTAPEKAGVLSFVLAGQKTEEIGGLLDKEGIAVRSGHHCAQPILRRFGVEATVRASLGPYNTCEDIDALVAALRRLQAGHVALG
jgi:cysteine desulfurase/selenocysteine lyase